MKSLLWEDVQMDSDACHGTTLFALTSILRDGQLKNSAEDHRPAGVYVTPLLQLAKESSQTLKTPSVLLSKSLCLTQAGRRTFVFGINQTSATSSGFSTNPVFGCSATIFIGGE